MHHEVLILIGDIIIAQSAMSPKLILVHRMHPTRLNEKFICECVISRIRSCYFNLYIWGLIDRTYKK